MGLSSQLAPSAIARPGVIANAAARPASPYDGQVIYQQDTDQAYVWNGSAWVYLSTSTANPVGLELVKTQTIGTAVSSVTVTDAFSANYDNYKIIVNGGTSTGNAAMSLRLGSSTTGYYQYLSYFQYSGTPLTAYVNNASIWAYVGEGTVSVAGVIATIELCNPFRAYPTNISGFYPGSVGGQFAGYHSASTSYSDFTLVSGSGTYTGGTISVYGYKK